MPPYTIFKHHVGRDTPSFEMVERASPTEARAYALRLLADNPDYERLEIVGVDEGYEEALVRPGAVVEPESVSGL